MKRGWIEEAKRDAPIETPDLQVRWELLILVRLDALHTFRELLLE